MRGVLTAQYSCKQLRYTSLLVLVGDNNVLFYNALVGIERIVSK